MKLLSDDTRDVHLLHEPTSSKKKRNETAAALPPGAPLAEENTVRKLTTMNLNINPTHHSKKIWGNAEEQESV